MVMVIRENYYYYRYITQLWSPCTQYELKDLHCFLGSGFHFKSSDAHYSVFTEAGMMQLRHRIIVSVPHKLVSCH